MKLFQKPGNKKVKVNRNIPLWGMFFVFLYIMVWSPVPLKAQSSNAQPDTVSKVKKHSPKLATLLSAVIPGAGQAYNKKYWKIPIIYVGLGALGYMANRNNGHYNDFKKAYSELYTANKDSTYMIDGVAFTLNGLDAGKNYYRRYRDLYVIFTAGLYLLNIVDANVDAHLFDFDISDNISLRITPSADEYWMAGPVPGIKINISF